MKRVTVYDIAERLDLSPSTVSRSLNASSLISPETRARVLAVAEELGYLKRAVRRQRSRAILNIKLILPGFSERYRSLFYDPAELVRGIRLGAEEIRFNLLLDIDDGNLTLFDHKKGGDLDGVICAFTRPPARVFRQLHKHDVPVLTIHRQVPDEDYINGDNQKGMADLVDRLVKRFGKDLRPAFLGFKPAADVSNERREGVIAACKAHGIDIPNSAIREISGISAINDDLIHWLRSENRNALLAYNDLVAASVQTAAARCGLSIPNELALTGFDDSPLRELLPKPLDTITLPVKELGIAAGQWISQRVIERSAEPIQRAIAGTYLPGKTV